MDLHIYDDDGNDDGELENWEGSMMNFVAVKKKAISQAKKKSLDASFCSKSLLRFRKLHCDGLVNFSFKVFV